MEHEPPTQPPGRVATIDAPDMAEAFRTARARMSDVPATVSGYRLFWVRDGDVGWRDLPAGGPYAVVGSHELCDVVLPEPGIELRHLLATTIELSDGLALRLLDLHTSLPFVLQDGSDQRSIVAAGPVVVRLGRTVLGGLPIDAGHAPEPPAPAPALPEMVVARSSRVPVSIHPRGSVSSEGSGPSSRGTSVTSMPPSHMIARMQSRPPAALPPPPPPSQDRELPPAVWRAGGPWAVTLEREQHAASVSLSEEELSVGVMIGRSPGCHDRGLRSVLDTYISRGHVLLLHHHETYEAFDLRSMNGTWEAGRAVKRRRLGAERATLELATSKAVVLHWHGRA
jgi:hypothetical protein